jgi:hypothetical protein
MKRQGRRLWNSYLQATEEAYGHVKAALLNLQVAQDLLPGATCGDYERVAISKSLAPLERVLLELACFRFEGKEQKCSIRKHEWLISELAHKLRVAYGTIQEWIYTNKVEARKLDDGRWVVTADEDKCRELTACQSHQHQLRRYHESSSAEAEL